MNFLNSFSRLTIQSPISITKEFNPITISKCLSFENRLINQNQSNFHTNSFSFGRHQTKSSKLNTPTPDPFAPSPFPSFPHRPSLNNENTVNQESIDAIPLSDQKISIFPPYRKIALKIPALTRGPTNILEFYVDQRMTKPEMKMWLENVYNIQGIQKIHSSTHNPKKRIHRLYQKRKILLSPRKKIYVELNHEIDFTSPRTDELPYFDTDVIEDIAKRVPSNGDASIALNWHNRKWLKEMNAPSNKLHVHQSRHKFIRKEMNKRLIIQKTLNRIEELKSRVEKIKEQQNSNTTQTEAKIE